MTFIIAIVLWYLTTLGALLEARDRLLDAVHAWLMDAPVPA